MVQDELTIEAVQRRRKPLAGLRITVLEGPDTGATATVEAGMTLAVGVAADNELELKDPTVSRYHIEAQPARDGISVRDLGSLNGTHLADARLEAAVVPPGTRLRLGKTLVLVEDGVEAKGAKKHGAPEVPGLVAESPAMAGLARHLHQLAPTTVSVLLHGETGTGKEVVARALHTLSPRASGSFEVVDCGSMAPTLIASALFGHERGAFTGAERRYVGAFERAHGGTVFLDEIGELPLDIQPTLLGVLERRRFRRVGGDKEIEVDVRIVSASHRDLREAANSGAFRADLYFRLAVARIVIPPLRERPQDIEPLVRHFTQQITGDPSAIPFDAWTLDSLQTHPWGGNIRELRNVVESALAMGFVQLDGGPLSDRPPTPEAPEPSQAADEPRPAYRDARAEAIASFEQSYLGGLIQECGGNASEAARRAKMDRAYLVSLLKKHGMR